MNTIIISCLLAFAMEGTIVAAQLNTIRSIGLDVVNDAQSNANTRRRLLGIGDKMAGTPSMMCSVYDSEEFQEDFEEDLASKGIVCKEFGCDDDYPPNLVMDCSVDGEVCEEQAGERFCLKDISFQVEMGLGSVSLATATDCGNYTSPKYMADMGYGCWTVDVTVDIDQWVEDMLFADEMEPTMTDEELDEEAEELALENVQIDGCDAEFSDGTTCECEQCDDSLELKYTCDNGLSSQECMDAGVGLGILTDPDISVLSVSVIKLFPSPETDHGAATEAAPETEDEEISRDDSEDSSPDMEESEKDDPAASSADTDAPGDGADTPSDTTVESEGLGPGNIQRVENLSSAYAPSRSHALVALILVVVPFFSLAQ
jgi:hypothetical protein